MELFAIALAIAIAAGWWKIFEKAGRPCWASLIPFYNFVLKIDIAGIRRRWIIYGLALVFIPLFLTPDNTAITEIVVNVCSIVFLFLLLSVETKIAKNFGKSLWFAVGLTFLAPIFVLILGFDSSEYKGKITTKEEAEPSEFPFSN